jgi:glutathione S-transferase
MNKLYAIPHSLYAGRARSYLFKAGIPFTEYSTGHESYKVNIVPKSKLRTVPTLETAEGQVIRDGAAIIDHFESATGRPFQPKTPKQSVVSALFDLIGSDGLLRPAMHYRWNFLDENEAFVRYHFLHSQRLSDTREAKTEYMMEKMQTIAGLWGVGPETSGLVESLYVELLGLLNAHFEQVAYLFGWKPSIGDFGLIAPMYAHLGRDPAPAQLMKQKAIRVYRWVERMNRPDQDAPEYFDAGNDYLENDEIPDSLVAVLQLLAEDLVPETKAAAKHINTWLAQNNPKPGVPAERFFDKVSFKIRGQEINSVAQPYRFYMLQRVHDLYHDLNVSERAGVNELFQNCGLSEMLTTQLNRRLAIRDNLDVWV